MKRLALTVVVVSMFFAIAGCGLWDSPFGDPTTYIVGEWTFEEGEEYDTIVMDTSLFYHHDGTVKDKQRVPGYTGYALKIEELDNAVEIWFDQDLQPTGSLTVEGWINPSEDLIIDGTDNVSPIVVADNVYALSWDSSKGLTFTIYQDDGEDKVYTAARLNEDDLIIRKDTWTHVAMAMEANFYRLNLYVNGRNVASFTDETLRPLDGDLWNSPGDYVYLGKSRDGALFVGCLDNVRIYNTVVTQSWLGYYADEGRWFNFIW